MKREEPQAPLGRTVPTFQTDVEGEWVRGGDKAGAGRGAADHVKLDG